MGHNRSICSASDPAGKPAGQGCGGPGRGRGGMQTREVSFASDGITLAGHLRVPEDGGPPPAVALTGPLSGVKEQVTGLDAEKIAAAGYVTLSFDHRNFGASGGAPRQHEDAAGKLHDLRAAVSFLTAQPEVDPAQIG